LPRVLLPGLLSSSNEKQLTPLASLPRSVASLLPKAFTLRLEVQLEEQILCSFAGPNQLLNSGFVLPVARFLPELLTLLFSTERKISGKTLYLVAEAFFVLSSTENLH
jgi:hypothetical protein